MNITSVQFISVTQSYLTLCDPMNNSMPGLPTITNSRSLLKLISVQLLMPSSHLILCRPLLLLPPTPPKHKGLFQWVNYSHEVAKILEFQFQHHSFQWIARTDLFRMDWLDWLDLQGTLKSLLQHHSSKASILWHSAFFTAQLSHPYMTTGKTIALTRQTFVGKIMSLICYLGWS